LSRAGGQPPRPDPLDVRSILEAISEARGTVPALYYEAITR
jgi:hypothetical protein